MSDSYIEVELNQQPIELYKLLKIADLVSGGGEAKVVITEGYVLLNGEVEYQKRKKVYHQDIIQFNGEVIQLVINEEANTNDELLADSSHEDVYSADEHKKKSKPKAKSKKPQHQHNATEHGQVDIDNGSPLPKKRKPISF